MRTKKIFESIFNAFNNNKSIISQKESIPPLFRWYLNLNIGAIDIYSLLKENENLAQLEIRVAAEYKEIEEFSQNYFMQHLIKGQDNNDDLEVLRKHNRLLSRISQIFINRNIKGIEFEKQNNLDLAIKLYEENLNDGFIGTHPYERLTVIYRKNKQYDDEIRIIQLAIEVFSIENERRFFKALNIAKNQNLKELIAKGHANCEDVRNDDGWIVYSPYPVKKYKERLVKSLKLKEKNNINH
jgi:hypothetical protein